MQNKSWYSRNKKWFLPTVIGGPILVIALFAFLILSLVYGVLKNSDSYKMSMYEVQENKDCIRLLGSPIKAGYWITGQINKQGFSPNQTGTSNLRIPLEGTLAEGTAYSSCEIENGKWEFLELSVDIKDTVIHIK